MWRGGSHDEFGFQFVVGFAFPRGKALAVATTTRIVYPFQGHYTRVTSDRSQTTSYGFRGSGLSLDTGHSSLF